MKNLKLSVEILPRGAWGNNLRTVLSKKDWDVLRNRCYEKAGHKCEICGDGGDLDAHEVWDFDIETKTQTLKDIVALCSACHGVKHIRNSARLGFGKVAKAHFLKVNECDEMTFASHVASAQALFDEQNQVLRWKLNADLSKFGGAGMPLKERNIPLIRSPYETVDWDNFEHMRKERRVVIGVERFVYLMSDWDVDLSDVSEPVGYGVNGNSIGYFEQYAEFDHSVHGRYRDIPRLRWVEVDNYEGTILIKCVGANKCEWYQGDEVINTKYTVLGIWECKFSVEDLELKPIRFVLSGEGGTVWSQEFELYKM